jgi:uncharacterized protein DUF3455
MKPSSHEIIRFKFASAKRLAAATLTLLLLPLLAPIQVHGTDNRAPELTDATAAIAVPAGQKVHFHAYAEGVQIYAWNGSTWVFQAPDALLFDNDGTLIGSHYATTVSTTPPVVLPVWESNSGSLVIAERKAGVTVTQGVIPWLLLRKFSTDGNGIFADISYVQRVNTTGGVPTGPGVTFGEIVRVPYTADYYFYREKK